MFVSRRKLVEIVNLTSVARSASPLHNRRSMEHIPWHITVNALRITFERGVRTLKNLARNVERKCASLVGMTGLEPATSRPPDACANQLRYIPIFKCGCKDTQIFPIYKVFIRFLLLLRSKCASG